jgi:hypothetical protein
MPVRKILEESAVSQEAARAMHTAFDSIVQALEQAGTNGAAHGSRRLRREGRCRLSI